jgi:hypothetical protein
MELTPEDVRYAKTLYVAVIGDFRGKGSESWSTREIPATDKFPACSVSIKQDHIFTKSGKDIDKVIRWNLMLGHAGDICSYYVMNAPDTNQAFRYLTAYAKSVREKNPIRTPATATAAAATAAGKATPGVVRDPFTRGFSLGEISRRCSYMRTQEERKERLRRAEMGKPHHSFGGGGGGGSRRRHVAKSKRRYSRRK